MYHRPNSMCQKKSDAIFRYGADTIVVLTNLWSRNSMHVFDFFYCRRWKKNLRLICNNWSSLHDIIMVWIQIAKKTSNNEIGIFFSFFWQHFWKCRIWRLHKMSLTNILNFAIKLTNLRNEKQKPNLPLKRFKLQKNQNSGNKEASTSIWRMFSSKAMAYLINLNARKMSAPV